MSNVIGPVQDAQDPWAIAQGGGYSEDNVYLRATDGKGHSVNVQAPLSTNMHAAIQEIVGMQQTKYRSVQDFIRDAVVHRAKYWTEQSKLGRVDQLPGVDEHVRMEILNAKVSMMRAREGAAGQLVKDNEQLFGTLIGAGLLSTAEELLTELEGLMGGWADLPSYDQLRPRVDRMRDELDRQLGG